MVKRTGFKVLALGIALVFILSFAGCAQKTAGNTADNTGSVVSSESTVSADTAETAPAADTGSEKVTIRLAHTYSGSDAKAPLFAEMLKKFRGDNPNIDLVEETATGDELRTKVKVDMASGNLADVITYWGGSILKPLVDNKLVLDINEYLKLSKSLKKEDISAGAWAFYTFDGTTYGVPMEGYRGVFIVNKDLFAKNGLQYPKTEKDLLDVAAAFNAKGIIPLAMGSKGGNPSHFYFSELYNQLPNGTQEIEGLSSSYKFATDNALKISQIIDEQRKAGVYPKDTIANGDWTPSFELYNSGKAAMIYTYPWMIGQMKTEVADISEIVPVPKIDGATKDPATFVSSSAVFGFVINKASFEDSKKKDAIVAFADFMTTDDMFKELAKGGLVPTKNVQLDLTTVNPMMKKVYEYTAKLEGVPDHFNTFPEDNAFSTFQNSLDELFAGALTPDAFVKKVQDSLDKVKK